MKIEIIKSDGACKKGKILEIKSFYGQLLIDKGIAMEAKVKEEKAIITNKKNKQANRRKTK